MKGVTVIELVVSIVVLGIVSGIAAAFLVPAFDAYFASQRRAQLVDVSDTALRRVVRELRLALPNSARVDPSGRFLEILLTRTGGRYRASQDSDAVATTEDPLRFDSPDDAFDTLGLLPAGGEQQVQAGDWVVIHNLGIPGANAYDRLAAPPNIAQVAAAGAGAIANESRITLAAATRFALESPARRFFVITGPVSYACIGVGLAGGNGTGTLRRWSGYTIEAAQPTALPGGATEAVLAEHVSACELRYTNLAELARGLVAIRLTITRGSENVVLYQEAHVNNVP